MENYSASMQHAGDVFLCFAHWESYVPHPLFLMLFRKGQNQLKSFTPHGREKLPERTNLSCSPGGRVCILQCRQLQEVYRRYIPIQQNIKTPPGLRTPLSSHDISSPEVGQPSKCLLCLPVQCSQSISEGEAVQQWGLLSGTVFPAAHHQKGSRT